MPNLNKIKTNTGSIWLTVPVKSKNHFEKKIITRRKDKEQRGDNKKESE